MSIPLATVDMWLDQIRATNALLAQVSAAAAAAPPNPVLGRQYLPWRLAAEGFLRGQVSGIPPLIILPPPLPPIPLIRPDAWVKLLQWDTATRQWADRWRRAGGQVGPLPPNPEAPPMLDPSQLGLGIGTGLGVGTIAALAALGIGLAIYARR